MGRRPKDSSKGSKTKNYLNNPNLPTRGSSFEYTEEMIVEIAKCKEDILHFAEGYFYILNIDEGRKKIQLYDAQRKVLEDLKKHRFNLLLSSRQSGKSTLATIYTLWLANFFPDQRILLVANKEATAMEIFQRVRMAYEMLPNWLKSPIDGNYGKTSMELENGSKISITTTTGTAARGSSISCVDGDTEIEIIREGFPFKTTVSRLYELTGSATGVIVDDDPNIKNLIETAPKCKSCGTRYCAFDEKLIQYSEVCSQECSDAYIDLFHKRLMKNSTNTYKTNIGKNENKILEIVKEKVGDLKNFKKSHKVGPYICDALINDDIIVEVNERHHLYNEYLRKDKEKYKYILSKGYKLLLVWDMVPVKTSTKEKMKKLNEEYMSLGDVAIAYHVPSEKENIKILTDGGIVSFSGVVNNGIKKCKEIKTKNGKSLICSYDHKLFHNGECKKVIDMGVGDMVDTVDGVDVIDSIEERGELEVYDIVGSDSMSYVSNGFLSHNCLLLDELAFIDSHLLAPFWASVFPVISSSRKAKIFACSTPNGTGNLFHKLYSESQEGKNGWRVNTIRWFDVPGRDEKWAEEIRSGLASEEAWRQEFGCEFLNTGTSSMNSDLYRELKKNIQDPVEILMDGKYKIFAMPNSDRIYVAGVDCADGLGGDYSVIKILDITDPTEIEEVAEYYDNTIPILDFANKVHEILQHWGNPLVCVERNNQGGQVVDRLVHDFAYPRVVSWGSQKAHRKSFLNGMVSSRTTKYHAVANARYFYNERGSVIFRNDDSLEEIFKDFVNVNDTWKAVSGKHDDRTMALIWALMVLDKELVDKYFEVEEYDDCGKPKKIIPVDHGLSYFENPTSIYTNEVIQNIEGSSLAPVSFGVFSEVDDEFASLASEGWKPLQGGIPYIDPNRNLSQEQYDAIERWF